MPLFEVIIAYLEEMEDAGVSGYWDEMTEFLLLMSLLVEVKSRLLLPRTIAELEGELTPEEARDQLLARLFEYSKFKAAAAQAARAGGGQCRRRLLRPAGESPATARRVEEIAGTEDALELRDHVLRLIESKRPPDTSHIAQIKVELQTADSHRPRHPGPAPAGSRSTTSSAASRRWCRPCRSSLCSICCRGARSA